MRAFLKSISEKFLYIPQSHVVKTAYTKKSGLQTYGQRACNLRTNLEVPPYAEPFTDALLSEALRLLGRFAQSFYDGAPL